MTPEIRATLEAMNPWLTDTRRLAEEVGRHLPRAFVPRRAADRLRTSLQDPDRAHLVVGPRQAGKSSLVWSLCAEGGPLLFLNCEERLVREWSASPARFVQDVSEFLPPGGRLFLDEAQWLPEAGLFVKGIVDAHRGWIVVVTGSASFHLLSRTRESLAGRATRHTLFPFSLDEVEPGGDLGGVLRMRRRAALDQWLVYGGYPGIWTRQDREAGLRDLVEAFVMRDASDLFRIERPGALRSLMRLAAGQVGDLVSMSEWASLLGVAGTTVATYLALLEETHVLVPIRPYIGGKRAELTRAPKVYFLDNGLRNAVAGGFGPLPTRVDRGKLLESFVFAELHKRWPSPGAVRFWRSKNGAEVDFVIEGAGGREVGLEVKSAARGRLSRSARSFLDAYRPPLFLLVHRGEARSETYGDTELRWVPAEMLPEVLDAL